MHKPTAFLFANGNAAFCDESGEQIAELQALHWRGIHEFLRRYPDAEVNVQGCQSLPPASVWHLLRSIAEPRQEGDSSHERA